MQITDFPIFAATIEGRRVADVGNALEKLTEGVDAGEISNVVYKDKVKYYLDRAFDNAWKIVVQKPFFWNFDEYEMTDAERRLDNSLNGYPMAHTVNTFIKRIEKANLDTEFTRTALALLAEMKVISDAIVSLKDKVVKRQPKAPEDLKAKYNAPWASMRAIGQVRDILIEITDKAFQELLRNLQDHYERSVALYVERTNALFTVMPTKGTQFNRDERKIWKDKVGVAFQALPYGSLASVVEKAEQVWNSDIGMYFERLVETGDTKAQIDAFALRDAEEIRDNFVYKNLVKLDSILEAKGDFDKIEIVGYQLSLGGLEGTLRLTFKDGAAFTIVNKVVNVTNSYGTNFDRFPLTFRDVVMRDGSKMRRPSEERMNTVFVGKAV